MHSDLQQTELNRLRWHCHRGMLEIDMLLLPFFDSQYQNLTDQQKLQFKSLLTYQDPDIFAWLMGHAKPEDKTLLDLIEQIRQHAQTSP